MSITSVRVTVILESDCVLTLLMYRDLRDLVCPARESLVGTLHQGKGGSQGEQGPRGPPRGKTSRETGLHVVVAEDR